MKVTVPTFMKHEHGKGLACKQLKELYVRDATRHLPASDTFCGSGAEKVLKDMDRRQREEFYAKLKQVYTESAAYVQTKFPLNNLLLRCLSAVDPSGQGQSATFRAHSFPQLWRKMSMMPITERHPTFRLTRGYLKLRWMESL
jgi:hypothetical protein